MFILLRVKQRLCITMVTFMSIQMFHAVLSLVSLLMISKAWASGLTTTAKQVA